jgi:hypothetical protein
MNKFHLIKTAGNKDMANSLAKANPEKIVSFRSAEAYAAKLMPTL